jgi:hypothetical protein
MTIFYVTTGAWGSGTGAPLAAAQVDGNFFDVDQRIVDLVAEFAAGKMIESVSYASNSFTLHFTDGTTQVIPLPVATLTYRGEWQNSNAYLRGDMVSVHNLGFFQVLVDHSTPPPPAPFDPNAVDGSSNPLYKMFLPLGDTNYDAAIFVPGSVQRVADELIYQAVANRPMQLLQGNANSYGYLDVGNDAVGATDIVIAVEKNGASVGTVTFVADGDIDASGGQFGEVYITADVDYAEGDRYGLRAVQSSNVEPSGLSITLPFLRKDI